MAVGESMIVTAPPPHLTACQRRLWAYYAPHLVAEGRLPAKSRDVLSKYVVALDMVAKLNRQIRSVRAGGKESGEKHPLIAELRAWLSVSRLYESDLLLNPASIARAPRPIPPPDHDDDDELTDILN